MHSTSPQESSSALRLVEGFFKKYYLESFKQLILPQDLEFREIAYQPFDTTTYVRHKAFSSGSELYEYIKNLPSGKTPKHIFYSSARYELPAAPVMEEKGWLGSSLVFDIDSDHLPECESREYIICDDQVLEGDSCPQESKMVTAFSTVSTECLARAYDMILELVELMESDFGLTHKNSRISFSGNRGFHLVYDNIPEEFLYLGSDERRGIVNYVKGEMLDIGKLFPENTGKRVYRLAFNKDRREYGWRRRILKYIEKHYSGSPDFQNDCIVYSIKHNELMEILDKARILVDEKVTIDTSRLIRIPGSLHGKTGLKSTLIDTSNVVEKILEDPLSLSPYNTYMIKLKSRVSAEQLHIYNRHISLNKDDYIIVEGGLAIFLMLNGLAEFVAYKV